MNHTNSYIVGKQIGKSCQARYEISIRSFQDIWSFQDICGHAPTVKHICIEGSQKVDFRQNSHKPLAMKIQHWNFQQALPSSKSGSWGTSFSEYMKFMSLEVHFLEALVVFPPFERYESQLGSSSQVGWKQLNTFPCLCWQRESYDSEPGAEERSSWDVELDETPGVSYIPQEVVSLKCGGKIHVYPFQGPYSLFHLRSGAALSSPCLEAVSLLVGKSTLSKHQNRPLPASNLFSRYVCRSPVGWTKSGILNMAHVCIRLLWSLNFSAIVAFVAPKSWFS